jgi:large subunit ribosomal protein L17
MRHRKDTFKIGRTDAHRRALLANQVASLIHLGEIQTTLVKAKHTRRFAEKLVTLGKEPTTQNDTLALAARFSLLRPAAAQWK